MIEPQNNVLVTTKVKIENKSVAGLYLGEQKDDFVFVLEVVFKNSEYQYEIGEKLLVPYDKLIKSKVNGIEYYFVKVPDILGVLK